MTSLRERVARALFEFEWSVNTDKSWAWENEIKDAELAKYWFGCADAALSAIGLEEIEKALGDLLAYCRLSTEPQVIDLLYRSPAAELQRQAEMIERKDDAIRRARSALTSLQPTSAVQGQS